MKGAREYYGLLETGQYGKLYIQVGSHARGKTLHIWVVPNGEEFKPQYGRPFNPNAVEVYGITGGQPGWTETYGWLHEGPWQKDFENLIDELKIKQSEAHDKEVEKANKRKRDVRREIIKNLSIYLL